MRPITKTLQALNDAESKANKRASKTTKTRKGTAKPDPMPAKRAVGGSPKVRAKVQQLDDQVKAREPSSKNPADPRWTKKFWAEVRKNFETIAACSPQRAAKMVCDARGIDRVPRTSSCHQHAKTEGWIKNKTMAEVRSQSIQAADLLAAKKAITDKETEVGIQEVSSVDLRAAKLDEHRNDWPILRKELLTSIQLLTDADKNVRALIDKENAARAELRKQAKNGTAADKALSLMTMVEEMRLFRTFIVNIKTRIEALLMAVNALAGLQKSEAEAWDLHADAPEDNHSITPEFLAEMDQRYADSFALAEQQRQQFANRIPMATMH
jgi:hypothetical protein